MNLCRRNNSAVLLALLTKRMLTDVAVTNPFPGTAILLVDIWGALEFVVLSPCNSRMVFTVLPICQPGAARIWAGSFRSTRHCDPPSSEIAVAYTGECSISAPDRKPFCSPYTHLQKGMKKALTGLPPWRLFPYSFGDYNNIIGVHSHTITFTLVWQLLPESWFVYIFKVYYS